MSGEEAAGTRPESVAERAVIAARGWIGTPYLHQCSTRGAGADCLGLIRGVWREVVGPEPEELPPYTPDWSEPAREERLWQAAGQWLVPRAGTDPVPGDVVLFRMRAGRVAKHLGLISGPQSFIHAYAGHGVVESGLSGAWRRRIVARFGFPEKE
ncbi:peptidase [Mesobaculum littorinae]|uniref:Peptidase n=1 Tax=Mesobaculum littorinae TaxID=2486419 RepID=A0A438AK72_9RHOB|nr:NlpC/P60 family protein [Mesobaculum littorinae]RVV99006.1 peptidase [Mesobaculum littorinae]